LLEALCFEDIARGSTDSPAMLRGSVRPFFRSEGIDVIPTPARAPNANAFMERWIRSARGECLDKLLIINQTHLRRVMGDSVEFFNTARPHQGLEQQIPVPKASGQGHGSVRCRTVLGGIIHDYYREAA
jgi:putative transposase